MEQTVSIECSLASNILEYQSTTSVSHVLSTKQKISSPFDRLQDLIRSQNLYQVHLVQILLNFSDEKEQKSESNRYNDFSFLHSRSLPLVGRI